MRRVPFPVWLLVLALSLLLRPCSAFSRAPKPSAEEAVLRSLGVDPTRVGVTKFLGALLTGAHKPLTEEQAKELISQLGSNSFEKREIATRKLLALLNPPLARLREATTNRDLEIARRAQKILAEATARPEPAWAVCRVIAQRNLMVSPSLLLRLIEHTERPATLEAALDALAGVVRPTDEASARKWLASKNPRVQAAGVRVLPSVMRGDPVPELVKWLAHEKKLLRETAAWTLAERMKDNDFSPYAKVLEPDSLALVIRAAERHFRHDNKDSRGDSKIMGAYEKLTAQYAEALKKSRWATHTARGPNSDASWTNIRLDTSTHPEVLLYRVKWFTGPWSAWAVPGFNDRLMEAPGKPDGRNIRWWACFFDHQFEIITTKDKEKYREIMDLP